jgi:hypothetical protein
LNGQTLPEKDDTQPATPQGVDVLGRGPVHEAFAEPDTANPRPTPIVPKKPPDPIEEVPPDQKPEGDNVQWIPGYFAWDDDSSDFIWVSGVWRAVPPGRSWVPGHWAQVEGGWQWTPGFWADANQTEADYLPPPPPSIESGPSAPAPDDTSTYVPGCWVYREARFLWRPGFWMPFRPNWVYTPPRYCWSPGGYLFVDGYWDYDLAARGLLFAPVALSPTVLSRPDWSYQPSFVVPIETLVTALFVRPNFHHYYFGDYFDPQYEKHGFVPWVDYRIHKHAPDPLFEHVRLMHRTDKTWDKDLRGLYEARRLGQAPRPPHDLLQQTKMIESIRVNKTVQSVNKVFKVNNVQHVVSHLTAVTPLTKVDARHVKLQPVPKARLLQERKASKEFRTVAQERQKIERKVVAKGPPLTPKDSHKVIRTTLPKWEGPGVKHATTIKAPPPPPAPKHVEKPQPKYQPPPPIHVQPKPEIKPPPKEIKPPPKEIKPPPKVEPKHDIKVPPRQYWSPPKQQPPPKVEPKKPPPKDKKPQAARRDHTPPYLEARRTGPEIGRLPDGDPRRWVTLTRGERMG